MNNIKYQKTHNGIEVFFGKKQIGGIYHENIDSLSCLVWGLWVDQDYQNNGIATMLNKKLENTVKNWYHGMICSINVENFRMLKLIKKLEWTRTIQVKDMVYFIKGVK